MSIQEAEQSENVKDSIKKKEEHIGRNREENQGRQTVLVQL